MKEKKKHNNNENDIKMLLDLLFIVSVFSKPILDNINYNERK